MVFKAQLEIKKFINCYEFAPFNSPFLIFFNLCFKEYKGSSKIPPAVNTFFIHYGETKDPVFIIWVKFGLPKSHISFVLISL